VATKTKSGASKTAKASNRATSKARAVPAADIDRLVVLGGGRFVYLFHPDGRSLRMRTGSEEFVATVAEISKLGYGERIRRQIDVLAEAHPASVWTETKAALEAADAFTR
jgi:hypothetical protein